MGLGLMKILDKGGAMVISAAFNSREYVDYRRVPKTRAFRDSSNQIYQSQ